MAKADGALLDTENRFPSLSLDTLEHGQVRIDERFTQGYGVVLIYRGHW